MAPDDWEPGRTVDALVSSVVDGAPGEGDGAVVLLHTWPDPTFAALPADRPARSRDAGADVRDCRPARRPADGHPCRRHRMTAAVLAVDGGNSKTDVALVGDDGRLLAAVRGPTISHQAVGLERGMEQLVGLVSDAAARAGLDPAARPIARIGVHAIAGADYPRDVRMLERALAGAGLTDDVVVVNDTIGALWAGSSAGWGIALICGEGINGAAVAPDGRQVRFDGVGDISGDWGGGHSVGQAGLAAAVRATRRPRPARRRSSGWCRPTSGSDDRRP